MVDYNSTVLTLVNETTPDPWIIAAHGKYYMASPAVWLEWRFQPGSSIDSNRRRSPVAIA